MKLSKECIEAIQAVVEIKFPLEDNENWDEVMNEQGRISFMDGSKEVLTNPSIYEKAGLISLEDIADFYNWASLEGWYTNWVNWWNDADNMARPTTTSQLFQIYQQQK